VADSARDPAVVLESVTKCFGGALAVDAVSFTVARGTCLGLLGPNGAGKSTTLKMVYGSLRPTSGTIRVDGLDIVREPRRAKAVLGVAPQEDLLDPDLGVLQNLLFHARYHGIGGPARRAAAQAQLHAAGLEEHAGAAVATLSTGLRRRLVLARALLSGPRIVILDEPTRGLDRDSRRAYMERLQALKAAGVTLLLATHDLWEAESLCDRAVVMERGRVQEEGPLWEILDRCRDGHALAAAGGAGEGA